MGPGRATLSHQLIRIDQLLNYSICIKYSVSSKNSLELLPDLVFTKHPRSRFSWFDGKSLQHRMVSKPFFAPVFGNTMFINARVSVSHIRPMKFLRKRTKAEQVGFGNTICLVFLQFETLSTTESRSFVKFRFNAEKGTEKIGRHYSKKVWDNPWILFPVPSQQIVEGRIQNLSN